MKVYGYALWILPAIFFCVISPFALDSRRAICYNTIVQSKTAECTRRIGADAHIFFEICVSLC